MGIGGFVQQRRIDSLHVGIAIAPICGRCCFFGRCGGFRGNRSRCDNVSDQTREELFFTLFEDRVS